MRACGAYLQVEVLQKLLGSYVAHIIEHARTTLLPRFLALVRVRMPLNQRGEPSALATPRPIAWIIMPNLFAGANNEETGVTISQRFDLKGSTYMRHVKPKQMTPKAPSSTAIAGAASVEPGSATAAVGDDIRQQEQIATIEVLKDLNFCPHHGRNDNENKSVLNIFGSNIFSSMTTSKPATVSSSALGASFASVSTPEVAPLTPLQMLEQQLEKEEATESLFSESGSDHGSNSHGTSNSSGSHDSSSDHGSPTGAVVDHCRKLLVGPSRRAVLLEALKSDTAWLSSHHIMDYSLLLGVGNCPRHELDKERNLLADNWSGEQTYDSAEEDDDDVRKTKVTSVWEAEFGGVGEAMSGDTRIDAQFDAALSSVDLPRTHQSPTPTTSSVSISMPPPSPLAVVMPRRTFHASVKTGAYARAGAVIRNCAFVVARSTQGGETPSSTSSEHPQMDLGNVVTVEALKTWGIQ